jgi:hypothetical protein
MLVCHPSLLPTSTLDHLILHLSSVPSSFISLLSPLSLLLLTITLIVSICLSLLRSLLQTAFPSPPSLCLGKDKAADRCVLDTDAGFTRADAIMKHAKDQSKNGKDRRYFCIHFAHGVCAKGPECKYFHRVPTLEDDARCDELFDCFGRQRHNKHRDDMTGVGSFLKPCRTLFVGGILKHKYDTPQKLEETLWKYFGEWGEVECVNMVQRLSIAFVRFRVRTSAGPPLSSSLLSPLSSAFSHLAFLSLDVSVSRVC